MIQLFKNKKEQSDFQSILECHKNPFNSKSIRRVKIEIQNKLFDGSTEFKSTIYFKNENTSGYQYIYGDDFNDVVMKTKDFIDSL